MGFFRRLRRFLKKALCPHRRVVFIIKSRYYSQVQEIKVDFWQDFLVGLNCLDCQMELRATPVLLNRYPYAGEPRYPTDELNGLERAYWEAKG